MNTDKADTKTDTRTQPYNLRMFAEGVSVQVLGDSRAVISTRLSANGSVEWEVSRHRNFRTWLAHGFVTAEEANGYRVQVEVDELPPETRLYYRFKCNGEYSAQAQFRT